MDEDKDEPCEEGHINSQCLNKPTCSETEREFILLIQDTTNDEDLIKHRLKVRRFGKKSTSGRFLTLRLRSEKWEDVLGELWSVDWYPKGLHGRGSWSPTERSYGGRLKSQHCTISSGYGKSTTVIRGTRRTDKCKGRRGRRVLFESVNRKGTGCFG